ncbi:MAG TPA: aspartate aminotransferase family protein [Chlorobaculum parvum]|uniref:Acetylornithine aminotransferase n=1 Tax=Chlorobaculum parvum TaxID=274539 RepID=A0A7C5DJT2_9CHLB|nr:aspartate aminotransferase family protein [Chlorobaculum parvum]
MKTPAINLETEQQLFFHNYARLPLHIAYGKGSFFYTTEGDRYLDMIAGIGVNAIGYGDQRLEHAITEQAAKYIHVSNLFMQKPQFDLAAKLLEISGMSKVFFCNSGTEAIEAAIKLARRFAARNGDTSKTQVLSLTNCFHGRTYGALSLTAKPKYVGGFEPLVPETGMIDFNDIDDLERKVSSRTAAVFVEFVQGEGGIHKVSEAFIARLKGLAAEHDFLIVADEIQAGCGRTGNFFSYMPFDLQPDLVCAAKPLGGGLPLGAVIGCDKVAEVFTPGSHGTTFGGNPVACAAGLAMIEAIHEDKLMENATETGAMMRATFEKMAEKHAQILEIRQYGLMIGITVNREAKYYVDEALKRNVLVNATSQNVIRLLPPLSISKEEAQLCLDTLDAIFSEEKQA